MLSPIKFGIGQPVRRVEDDRFIRGEGHYMGEVDLPDQTYLWIVRSPMPRQDCAASMSNARALAQAFLPC